MMNSNKDDMIDCLMLNFELMKGPYLMSCPEGCLAVFRLEEIPLLQEGEI